MARLPMQNRCVEFEYFDADGVLTRRKVNASVCYKSAGAGFWYLEGFCHLRCEKRTFRTDRMTRLWDAQQGWAQVSDPSSWLDSLWKSLPAAQARAPAAARRADREEEYERYLEERSEREQVDEEARKIVAEQFHALRALTYVAKADKAFREAEKRLFVMFFKRIAHYRLDADAVEQRAVKFALELDPPTTGQFHYSVRQVAQRGRRYRMAVCATAKAMINTDKKVAPYELEVLDYLVRKLRPLDD